MDRRPADTTLLQTPRHVTEINSRYYGLSRYYGNVDTCRPPSATFPLFFSLTIADTSFKILNHIIKSDITREENKETILQLGANMKISCLWPVFFSVWLLIYRTDLFSLVLRYYGVSLLRTLDLPPRLSAAMRIDCTECYLDLK